MNRLTCWAFALQNTTRRKSILLLFWLEIIVILYSFLMVKGVVNYYEGQRQLVNSFHGEQCILLSSNDNVANIEQAVKTQMQTDPNIESVGSVLALPGIAVNEGQAAFSLYDDLFVEVCDLPLSKGRQLRECPKQNGVIPVIVGTEVEKTFHYGETYTINYAGEMKIQVVGVLKSANMYYSFSGGGTHIYLPGLFESDPYRMCFATSSLVDEPLASQVNLEESSYTVLVKVKETEGPAFENTCEGLSAFGYPNLGAHVKQESDEQLKSDLLPYLAQLIVVLLACLAGIYGYNMYKQFDNQRKNSICYLCGGTNRDFVHIQSVEAVLTLLIPTVLGLVWGCLESIAAQTYKTEFRVSDPFWALLLVVLIYAVSYLPYSLRQMKTQPIDMIRRFE